MRLNLLLPIIAAIVVAVGGYFYFYHSTSTAGAIGQPVDPGQNPTDPIAPTQVTTSTATNYDECIAEGNAPLAEDSDKCLTKDGHVFIKGVVE